MKKKYINPEMEVIIMKSKCSLLAGSDPDSVSGIFSGNIESDYVD